MLSNKPYLIRAFYEWIVDSACTPFLVVNANFPRCSVPQHFVEDGEITLNIAPSAVRDLKISNEVIEFRASFSGIVHLISAPIKSILGVYAQEDHEQGVFFDYEEAEGNEETGLSVISNATAHPQQPIPGTKSEPSKARPHLKLVE